MTAAAPLSFGWAVNREAEESLRCTDPNYKGGTTACRPGGQQGQLNGPPVPADRPTDPSLWKREKDREREQRVGREVGRLALAAHSIGLTASPPGRQLVPPGQRAVHLPTLPLFSTDH